MQVCTYLEHLLKDSAILAAHGDAGQAASTPFLNMSFAGRCPTVCM